MISQDIGRPFVAVVIVSVIALSSGCSSNNSPCTGNNSLTGSDGGSLAQTVFVAHDGVLVSYDVASGCERAGNVTNIMSPTDMQALEDGTVLVNLTARNTTAIVNGKTMLENGLVSSATGGTRPVHSYVSPVRNGKQYWVALYDGENSDPVTSKARFINVKAGTPNYLQGVGEVGLGIAHHKAAFSNTRERVIISNIADCNNVLTVYDYTGIANIQPLKTWTAADLLSPCNPSAPAPHGCATSKESGRVYCNLTNSGNIVAANIDATPPTFSIIHTHGSGSGYTKARKDGRFVYSLQQNPREGQGGVTCQIGQLVVIDARNNDAVTAEVRLLYKGPDCSTPLAGTDEATAEPDHIRVTSDGKTLYISTAGEFGNDAARVRQELVVDTTDPSHPVQKPSIPVGESSMHHGDALTGDERWVFVANNKEGTVTQIDASKNQFAKTLTVRSTPLTVATFGTNEGPSEQTGPIK